MNLHEDERRTLLDWGDSDIKWKTCKLVKAKQACELGNHFHKKKTERFLLVNGSCNYQLEDSDPETMIEYEPLTVHPNTKHTFWLSQGSILLCLCSESFDPKDDYV